MFRVLEIPTDPAAPLKESQGAARARVPGAGASIWVDLVAQDADAMRHLQEQFDFHPLAIEDCLNLDQRPKLEEYGHHLFLVTHVFVCPTDPVELEMIEVHFFLTERALVTVHEKPVAALDEVWKRVSEEPKLARLGVDFVMHQVVDGMVDANFPIIDLIGEAVEELEEKVLEAPERGQLERIFALRRTLTTMRRVLSPERDVFAMLAKRGDPRIGEKTALYFRDVYDHLVRIYESTDAARDLLGSVKDAYISMQANRTNEIMKRLAILSAIFLPLTFVTGFFGQNFLHLPFGSDPLMYTMIAACLLIPAGMVAWFYRSGWF